MDPASVATVLVAAIAACGTIVVALIARRAERNTRPLGNGFAPDVRDRLERIEQLIIDHLKDHASSDVARRT